jgi:hypothetical protein
MSKSASYRFVLAAAAVALLAADVGDAFARGGGRGGGGGGGMRGGGVRSGGSMSMSRPSGGGGFGGGSSRASAGTLPSGARPGGGGRGSGSRPGGDAGIGGGDGVGGNRPGNGNRPGGDNNFNRNTNINNNVNVGDGWGGWDDHIYHPIAAGIAIGAVAAAAYGSYYYALPTGCYPYGYGSYYNCGGAYLEPRYEGDTVVYVTVPEPKESSSGAATGVGAPTGAPAHTATPSEHVVTPPPAPKSP